MLEAERAARRAGVLQIATLNTVGAVGFMNVGVQLALEGSHGAAAAASMSLAAVFAGIVAYGMRRVETLDKFEKDIRGG